MSAGDVVNGRFALDAIAGRGGMGTVYRARDLATGGLVALKIVTFAGAGDRDRFVAEARALAELSHPCVVRYVWHGVDGGRGLCAMEWLEGSDLASRLGDGPLEVAETCELGRAIARALAEAHARDIIHRDLKPANVFLVGGDTSRALLLDFGLAAVRTTRGGEVEGTARYMAPEQARGERVDARADLFSLGCVLFECLTGLPAFDADRTLAVLLDVQAGRTQAAPIGRSDVPPEIEAVIRQMLERERERRPASAYEVALTLAGVHGPRTERAPSTAVRVDRERQGEHSRIGLDAPLVGRDSELRLVVATYEQSEVERVARAVVVSGPAGIGVSRVLRAAATASGAPCVQVRGSRFRADVAFASVVEIASTLVDARAGEVEVVHPSLEGDTAIAWRWLVASARPGGPPMDVTERLRREPERWESAMARALGELMLPPQCGRPALIVIDDAHVVDVESRRVLTSALRAGVPWVLLVGGPSTIETAWADLLAEPEVQPIRLGPLRPRAADRLATWLLGEGADADQTRRLVARSEGNPLFLVELAASPALCSGEVPTNVRATIEERMASLSEYAGSVLCAAGILDERIELDALAAAAGASIAGVEVVVDDLVRRDWLEPHAAGGFAFRQELARDVAARLVPPSGLSAMHERVADALARRSDRDPRACAGAAAHLERAAALADSIASRAALMARASRSWIAGGVPRAAYRAAHAALAEVDPLLIEPALAADWLETFGIAQLGSTTSHDYEELTSRWIAAVDARGTPEERVRARLGAARALASGGRLERAEGALEAAIALCGGSVALRARSLVAALEVAVRRGDVIRGVALADRLAAVDADRDGRSWLHETYVRGLTGDAGGAGVALERARASSAPDDLVMQSAIAMHESAIRFYERDFDGAVPTARLAAELSRKAGMPSQQAVCLHNLGDALHRLGRVAESREALEESSRAARSCDNVPLQNQNELHLAYLDALEGGTGAIGRLRAALVDLEACGRWGEVADVRVLLARASLGAGDVAAARADVALAGAAAERIGHGIARADVAVLATALADR